MELKVNNQLIHRGPRPQEVAKMIEITKKCCAEMLNQMGREVPPELLSHAVSQDAKKNKEKEAIKEREKFDVVMWIINDLGMARYIGNFIDNDYDAFDIVLNGITTKSDLINIGINNDEDINKILKVINDKRKGKQPKSEVDIDEIEITNDDTKLNEIMEQNIIDNKGKLPEKECVNVNESQINHEASIMVESDDKVSPKGNDKYKWMKLLLFIVIVVGMMIENYF